jgi:hypothetical protein
MVAAELLEGVHLSKLAEGSVIDLETKSRHYWMEYLGGDRVLVSGHPQWCPTPLVVHLRGSMGASGKFEPDFIGEGMRVVFQRFDDSLPVTTSEAKHIRLGRRRPWADILDGCRRFLGRQRSA